MILKTMGIITTIFFAVLFHCCSDISPVSSNAGSIDTDCITELNQSTRERVQIEANQNCFDMYALQVISEDGLTISKIDSILIKHNCGGN